MDESFSKLSTKELQQILKLRSCPIYYKKKRDLIKRLKESMSNDLQESLGEESSEETSAEEIKSQGSATTAVLNTDTDKDTPTEEPIKENKMVTKNVFSFQDVEEALENFDGESNKNCKKWVAKFEEVAVAFEWSDIQKFLYCRRLLKGAAKMAAEAEGCVTWVTLKEFLRKEFNTEFSSKHIHQKLSSTKKIKDESLLNYFYRMKQIGDAGDIEESALIEYIIAGINDTPAKKSVLYTATTCVELKARFCAYEKLKEEEYAARRNFQQPHSNSNSSNNSSGKHNNTNSGNGSVNQYNNCKSRNQIQQKQYRSQNQYRCYNCGSRDHKRADCTNETKCFKCGKFGHEAPQCPPIASTTEAPTVNLVIKNNNRRNGDV